MCIITPSPPPAHTPTYCNPWFLRSRAWLNNEINVGGWCCTHLFRPWYLDHGFARHARLFTDAQR